MTAGRKPADIRAVRAWKKHRPHMRLAALAAHEGITQPAVWKWRQVPEARLASVAAWLGVPEHALRPDIRFPDPWSILKEK